ncbi:hypothetical protein VP01_1080g14 [Puccinia sorghi]|uniref:Uncharacterized protein n=1 Tax=Puccinia sorghi TaxID=27349 RepID=A0A0L6VUT0_9BASI|nr:hypothetical protein VP01_1080g14 [Puccinia sorghi]
MFCLASDPRASSKSSTIIPIIYAELTRSLPALLFSSISSAMNDASTDRIAFLHRRPQESNNTRLHVFPGHSVPRSHKENPTKLFLPSTFLHYFAFFYLFLSFCRHSFLLRPTRTKQRTLPARCRSRRLSYPLLPCLYAYCFCCAFRVPIDVYKTTQYTNSCRYQLVVILVSYYVLTWAWRTDGWAGHKYHKASRKARHSRMTLVPLSSALIFHSRVSSLLCLTHAGCFHIIQMAFFSCFSIHTSSSHARQKNWFHMRIKKEFLLHKSNSTGGSFTTLQFSSTTQNAFPEFLSFFFFPVTELEDCDEKWGTCLYKRGTDIMSRNEIKHWAKPVLSKECMSLLVLLAWSICSLATFPHFNFPPPIIMNEQTIKIIQSLINFLDSTSILIEEDQPDEQGSRPGKHLNLLLNFSQGFNSMCMKLGMYYHFKLWSPYGLNSRRLKKTEVTAGLCLYERLYFKRGHQLWHSCLFKRYMLHLTSQQEGALHHNLSLYHGRLEHTFICRSRPLGQSDLLQRFPDTPGFFGRTKD